MGFLTIPFISPDAPGDPWGTCQISARVIIGNSKLLTVNSTCDFCTKPFKIRAYLWRLKVVQSAVCIWVSCRGCRCCQVWCLGCSKDLLSCGLLASKRRREVRRLKVGNRRPGAPGKSGTAMTNPVLQKEKWDLKISGEIGLKTGWKRLKTGWKKAENGLKTGRKRAENGLKMG